MYLTNNLLLYLIEILMWWLYFFPFRDQQAKAWCREQLAEEGSWIAFHLLSSWGRTIFGWQASTPVERVASSYLWVGGRTWGWTWISLQGWPFPFRTSAWIGNLWRRQQRLINFLQEELSERLDEAGGGKKFQINLYNRAWTKRDPRFVHSLVGYEAWLENELK